MIAHESTKSAFLFIGNYLCLDFVNTRILKAGNIVDMIGSFGGLAGWAAAAKVFPESKIKSARTRWSTPAVRDCMSQALDLRSRMSVAVTRLSSGKQPSREIVDAVNRVLEKRIGHTRVVRERGQYKREFEAELNHPVQLIVPIAESFGDLLCYADPSLIKKCGNPECVLWFYDTTRSHTRRWCRMSSCGNRAKAAAHYRRQHGVG
ncbi:MAG TPA: CGNR zinc finger domain-containing protein [Blastocatellia bacterium]|nr:CGNR zinc finger domain-containing protein [Blastocatellia bacterium]